MLQFVKDGVQEIRFDRPSRLNAITFAVAQELLVAVRAASTNPVVRVIVLSGEGRAFCAGKDKDGRFAPTSSTAL